MGEGRVLVPSASGGISDAMGRPVNGPPVKSLPPVNLPVELQMRIPPEFVKNAVLANEEIRASVAALNTELQKHRELVQALIAEYQALAAAKQGAVT